MNKFFQVSSIVDEFVFAREGAAKGNGGLKGFTYDAWTSNEKSWKQGKHLITREPVLKYFDPSKEVTAVRCIGIWTWCCHTARRSAYSILVNSIYEY